MAAAAGFSGPWGRSQRACPRTCVWSACLVGRACSCVCVSAWVSVCVCACTSASFGYVFFPPVSSSRTVSSGHRGRKREPEIAEAKILRPASRILLSANLSLIYLCCAVVVFFFKVLVFFFLFSGRRPAWMSNGLAGKNAVVNGRSRSKTPLFPLFAHFFSLCLSREFARH